MSLAKKDKKACKYTSLGGQALIEGIMMRGPQRTVMATRMPDQSIDLEELSFQPMKEKCKILGWPLIRGVVGMIESLRVGYRALMRSAEKAGVELEEEEPGPVEKKLTKLFGDKLFGVIMAVAMVLGVGLALFLFMYLPVLVFNLLNYLIPADIVGFKGLIEGVLKILIFLAYVALTSLMPDIKRVYQYHGAEHKTIFCYEAKMPLTVENVRVQRRFHPRCGTSFLILMLVVSILVSTLVLYLFPALAQITWLWVIIKILLIPLVCGLGYELIKWCGRSDNLVTRIIAAPGLWMQRLTTKEPDDSMIEVAIAAMNEVIPERAQSTAGEGAGQPAAPVQEEAVAPAAQQETAEGPAAQGASPCEP